MNANVLVDKLLESDPELMYQPDGITCGPTSIRMVACAIGKDFTLEEISAACGTNDRVGTTDVMLIKGLSDLGIPYQVGSERTPEGLQASLPDNFIILRTLTRGIKHWVVLYSFRGGKFLVNDPWLGQIQYTPDELVSIWKPRDFYYVEVPRR